MAGRFPGELRGVRQEFADGASSLDDAFRKNVHNFYETVAQFGHEEQGWNELPCSPFQLLTAVCSIARAPGRAIE
jgi:hypothetical protein